MPTFWKPKPVALDRKAKRAQVRKDDEDENKKVRERSRGLCEVVEWRGIQNWIQNCGRVASEIHHMIGGMGVRAKGRSKLAEHKQHVCRQCHREITGHVLKRVGDVIPRWSDVYERVG